MEMKTKIPVGVEYFAKMRRERFYYIDKTGIIKELLENHGKVNLSTRPRRFGKTLNMSMLKYFLEVGCDSILSDNSRLFDGLEISKESKLCAKYMGRFPIISISLKGATGTDFDSAGKMLRRIIGKEAMRFQYPMQSDSLTELECRQYKAIVKMDEEGNFTMTDEMLKDGLLTLSQLLQKHYGQSAVILIDEYDVPLDRAYQSGYYDAMVKLLKGLFGQALKTNDSLYFAVLTGCLRISKESNVSANAETMISSQGDVLFTGLNNFNVCTVKDVQYNEYFGFRNCTEISCASCTCYFCTVPYGQGSKKDAGL